MKRLLLATLCTLALDGCNKQQEVTLPPPPLRPNPEPSADKQLTVPKDCQPVAAEAELKAFAFDERSISEGARLAEEAKTMLKTAASTDDRALREHSTTEAVSKLITALKADPYNVTATYHLAATYAHIGRDQCSINLLTRLLKMRPHPSKHAEVEQHLDRLLGRKTTLDPNFSDEIRRDERFRQLMREHP